MNYVDVVLPLPLDGLFTYGVSDEMSGQVKMGVRVLVPLGRSKTYTGIVVRLHQEKPSFEIKDILAVLDNRPMLLPQQMKLWQWMSSYYMSPIGEIYKAAFPAGLKAEDGYRPKTELYIGLCEKYRSEQALHIALNMLARAQKQQQALLDFFSLSHWDSLEDANPQEEISELSRDELMNTAHCTLATIKGLTDKQILYTYQKEIGRLNSAEEPNLDNVKRLNEAQQEGYNQILMQFMKHDVVLLHGVTSSGKTEIYIHLIEKALQDHKQVLYLLPEIALTVQIMERLQRVFGNRLGIYHSKYSDAERVEIWQKQLSKNPYDVILGARSAVFLPFQNLGLVIIDEEHETSFKQQDPAPRYHARSAAIVLAKMYKAKTLLGTATPSMESYYNAVKANMA
jgi:primosomal protein N' (replication factor Y)